MIEIIKKYLRKVSNKKKTKEEIEELAVQLAKEILIYQTEDETARAITHITLPEGLTLIKKPLVEEALDD